MRCSRAKGVGRLVSRCWSFDPEGLTTTRAVACADCIYRSSRKEKHSSSVCQSLIPPIGASCPPPAAGSDPAPSDFVQHALTLLSLTAGNRWHLDCFRCNTCSTLLDSDANLLLLGDGSLICNNCTYSCSACGNKIEDLAILTGDQAFCSTCFRCRNCKRKIENLRYARTSQGIFCMGCHETLMARRRKKSKAAAAAKAREKEQASPMVKEKSLPALPPNEIPKNAFSNERVDPDSDTPTEISPQPRPGQRSNEASSRGNSRPARSPERQPKPEGLGLSSHAYRSNRSSTMMSNDTDKDDGFFIPVALDPSPGPPSTSTNDASRKKDYFGSGKTSGADKRSDSQSSTPHIAFQDKGRQHSSEQTNQLSRKQSLSSKYDYKSSPSADERPARAPPRPDDFRLQEVPKGRKPTTSSDGSLSSAQHDGTRPGPPPLSESRNNSENILPPRRSHDTRGQEQDEVRPSTDSASARPSARTENSKVLQRKEVPNNATGELICEGAITAGLGFTDRTLGPHVKSEQSGSESYSDENPPPKPPRPSASNAAAQKGQPGSYMHPRSAPPPPGMPSAQEHTGQKDASGSPKTSPKLPRWSSGGDFTMDEDMARIMGAEEAGRHGPRASKHGRNASVESSQTSSRAGHARSVSETTRGVVSPRWSKGGAGAGIVDERNSRTPDLASPNSLSSADDTAVLKRQLRNSEQKVAELERKFNTEADLKNLNKKLIEKRKTVSVLDTQTEIMIRQLEVLAGYVEKAKETKEPIDTRKLEDTALKEFVQKLEHVRISMSETIEQLHEERDHLLEEKVQAMADRDRALMEFEQLSSKNAQLADMNNEMTHQLQERFRSQAAEGKGMNGLGIYGDNKAATASSTNLDHASMATTLIAADDESIVEGEPTVVQVRKGQIKKFNWKKGSKGLAQGLTKGVNRAVVAFQQNDRGERVQTTGLAGDNIGMPYNTTVTPMESPGATTPTAQLKQGEHGRQGFGFFRQKTNMPKSASNNAVQAPIVPEPPSTLFGSDLCERADFERRQIPSVVTRCIEEVELRGMDQEGIYRKTGGNSQINTIKDGLDKSENFDISDPDLDITAVTSVLKQYFRKLPTPLLSFDVYDRVLESVGKLASLLDLTTWFETGYANLL